MKRFFILLFCTTLVACTSQGYLLYNSSKNDVIVKGSFLGSTAFVWWGIHNPLHYFSRSNNCQVLYKGDSLITMKDYLNYLKIDSIHWKIRNTNDENINNVSIVVSPGGYIPLASLSHFVLRSVKKQTRCYPFLSPMEIIVGSDTLSFNDFELQCPPLLKPDGELKEIDGMIVLLEAK